MMIERSIADGSKFRGVSKTNPKTCMLINPNGKPRIDDIRKLEKLIKILSKVIIFMICFFPAPMAFMIPISFVRSDTWVFIEAANPKPDTTTIIMMINVNVCRVTE